MKKIKILHAIILCLVIIAGCSLDYGAMNNQASSAPVVQEVTESLSRASACAGLPQTKVVTTTGNTTRTYPLTNVTINSISNGSESVYYNDSCYSGVVRSIGYSVNSSPTINGGYITFNLTITYQGTVRLKPIDPCEGYAASKVVTQTRGGISKTYPVTSVTINSISNGSEIISYNDSCYRGTLSSIGFTVNNSPTISGGYITFNLTITYRGTVYKK